MNSNLSEAHDEGLFSAKGHFERIGALGDCRPGSRLQLSLSQCGGLGASFASSHIAAVSTSGCLQTPGRRDVERLTCINRSYAVTRDLWLLVLSGKTNTS
jgi:hypothetical protein